MGGYFVFVYAYRVSGRQPNPQFTLARADRLQAGLSLWLECDYAKFEITFLLKALDLSGNLNKIEHEI